MVFLPSRLRFRFSGLSRQAPWFFLKSEPGPVAVVSTRPGGGTRGGSRATNPKVKADDSGGSGVLARRDRARPDLAFSLPLTGKRPKSLKSDPRRIPAPVHDAVDPRGKMLNCHAQKCTGVFRLENPCGWQGKTKINQPRQHPPFPKSLFQYK